MPNTMTAMIRILTKSGNRFAASSSVVFRNKLCMTIMVDITINTMIASDLFTYNSPVPGKDIPDNISKERDRVSARKNIQAKHTKLNVTAPRSNFENAFFQTCLLPNMDTDNLSITR